MDHYWVGLYALEITGGNHPKSTYSLGKGQNLTLFGTCAKGDSVLFAFLSPLEADVGFFYQLLTIIMMLLRYLL